MQSVMQANPEKTAAIQAMKPPTNIFEMRRELGITTGQYCDISDTEPDSIITTLLRNFPTCDVGAP